MGERKKETKQIMYKGVKTKVQRYEGDSNWVVVK